MSEPLTCKKHGIGLYGLGISGAGPMRFECAWCQTEADLAACRQERDLLRSHLDALIKAVNHFFAEQCPEDCPLENSEQIVCEKAMDEMAAARNTAHEEAK